MKWKNLTRPIADASSTSPGIAIQPAKKSYNVQQLRSCLKMKNQNTDNTACPATVGDLKDLYGFYLY